MRTWCKAHPNDLSPQQLGTLLSLFERKHQPLLANEVKLLLIRKNSIVGGNTEACSEPLYEVKSSQELQSRSQRASFLNIPAAKLAKELTFMERKLFENVNLRNLLVVKSQKGDSLFEPIIAQFQLVRFQFPYAMCDRQNLLFMLDIPLGGYRNTYHQEHKDKGKSAGEAYQTCISMSSTQQLQHFHGDCVR